MANMVNQHLDDYLAAGEQALVNGRLEAAVAAYRAAVALRDDLPDVWFNLAWAERALQQFEPALASYANAIRHGVARPEEAHLNRAAILSDHLFRFDDAERELQQAIAAKPQFIHAWLNLGHLHEDRGAVEPARQAYAAAIAVDPSNGRAHARLGVMDIFEGQADRAVTNLTGVLESITDMRGRADALFALGGAHDALGRYDDAYFAYEAANWLARSASPTRYDRRAQDRLVDQLIRHVPAPAELPTADDRPTPIFILGMFRSGSTLIEQILSRHSAIAAGGELEFIPSLVRSLGSRYPEAINEISAEEIAGARNLYLSPLRELDRGTFMTDKRCDNFMNIGLIKRLFPGARFIHTKRNALDNFISIYATDFDEAVPYSHDLNDIAHYYLSYQRLMEHWQALYPDDIHEVDYDRLVASPRSEIEKTIAFLGLAWEPQLEQPSRQPSTVQTASLWQVRQPLHARSSGRWMHYAQQLATARTLLGLTPENPADD